MDRPSKGFGMVLSNTEAMEIYKCKLRLCAPKSFKDSLQSAQLRFRGQSAVIASRFGVSPKTVRDIWNRKTWSKITDEINSSETQEISAPEALPTFKEVRLAKRFHHINRIMQKPDRKYTHKSDMTVFIRRLVTFAQFGTAVGRLLFSRRPNKTSLNCACNITRTTRRPGLSVF